MAPIDERPTQFTRGIIFENHQLNAFAECKPSKDASRPWRDEYVLTEAGRNFLPVLFAIGAWGRKHRGEGKVIRFFDAENGTENDPLTIDRATGAPIGTRPIRVAQTK